MTIHRRVTGAIFALALASGALQASEPPQRQASLQEILAQQREIRAAVSAQDHRYAHLDAMRRSRLHEAQDRVFRLGEQALADGRLSADMQLQLFNDLKAIEALLVKQDVDDRMVCERVAIVGTRRYEMACMTRAERDARADSARKAMMERAACTTQACIGGD